MIRILNNDGTPFDLGAVLVYVTSGISGICGMTVGADGSGEYAILFTGSPDQATIAARDYLHQLERAGNKITTAILVPNIPQFLGESVRIKTTIATASKQKEA